MHGFGHRPTPKKFNPLLFSFKTKKQKQKKMVLRLNGTYEGEEEEWLASAWPGMTAMIKPWPWADAMSDTMYLQGTAGLSLEVTGDLP